MVIRLALTNLALSAHLAPRLLRTLAPATLSRGVRTRPGRMGAVEGEDEPVAWKPPPGFRNWDDGDDDDGPQFDGDAPIRFAREGGERDEDEWEPPPGFVNWDDDGEPADATQRRRSALPPLRERARPQQMDAEVQMPSGFCSGCGVKFQATDMMSPGYVPASVLEERTASRREASDPQAPLVGRSKPTPRQAICQRCHTLRYQNRLPADTLRVASPISRDEAEAGPAQLQPDYFRDLLRTLYRRSCVVVCLVDLFDFHGSLIPDLPSIVGSSSLLVLVGNKVDLLPEGTNLRMLERWVRTECRRANMPPIHSLDLVSCTTGAGMPALLSKLESLMAARSTDAYVLGAANAGKSSFINRLIRNRQAPGGRPRSRKGVDAHEGDVLTTSALPGTTLGFVKASTLSGRLAIYDTPGIILPGQLTTLLNTDELAAVVPKKRSDHVSLRLGEGKSLLLGGLVRIHFRRGRPFLFTCYLANAVHIHPTATEKVDDVLARHAGELLAPPASYQRIQELGPYEARTFTITGRGWNDAAVDLVLPGLGWVAVNGVGECEVEVEVPKPTVVHLREPLLPEQSTKQSYVLQKGNKLVDKRGNTKRRASKRR